MRKKEVKKQYYWINFTLHAEQIVIAESKEEAEEIFKSLPIVNVDKITSVQDAAEKEQELQQKVKEGKNE